MRYIYFRARSLNLAMSDESSEQPSEQLTSFTFCQPQTAQNPEFPLSVTATAEKEEPILPEAVANLSASVDRKPKGRDFLHLDSSLSPAGRAPHDTLTPKNKSTRMVSQQQTHTGEQQSDMNGYSELTLKLQNALNKISSSKKVESKTGNNLIHRFEECEEKKKREIIRRKEEIEQQRTKEIKDKPTINKYSERITKETGYQPIHKRFEKIVEGKKRKAEEIEEHKKKMEEKSELEFQEEYNKHVKKPDTVRTYEQYFTEMQRWKEKREEENRQKLQIQKSKQLEGITFQPKLNPKSKKMVSSQQRLPIEQRGLVRKKVEVECSFTPQTNHKRSAK